MKFLYILVFLFGFATIPAFSQPVTDTIEANSSLHDDLLSVVFVDLQTKGESILVMFPNGKTILIDGGMPSSYPKLESVLKQYNVTEIDVMIGTHADQDQ